MNERKMKEGWKVYGVQKKVGEEEVNKHQEIGPGKKKYLKKD